MTQMLFKNKDQIIIRIGMKHKLSTLVMNGQNERYVKMEGMLCLSRATNEIV